MEAFEYSHAGATYRGQLVLPEGKGPHPGVLVLHDGRGVSEFVCAVAQRWAALGYAALAADLFGDGRQYPDPAEGTAAVRKLMGQGELLRDRTVASFEAFRACDAVDARRIGAIGYCFGGLCVLELARSGAELAAVVSFHGGLATHAPAAPGAVRARVLVLTGALDPFAPAEERAAFEAEMSAAGADWHMTVYGSGKHGFTDPIADEMAAAVPGVAYSELLDRASWAQAANFLELLLHR